jgi:hypothetical protein
MGDLKRIAPIFAVRDLGSAMAHDDRLGFTTRAYVGGGYGFATRDGIEIHLPMWVRRPLWTRRSAHTTRRYSLLASASVGSHPPRMRDPTTA